MNGRGQTFDLYFEALTGFAPLAWQQRLFRDLVAGHLPSALDLPTGLGKTSVMAIWYLALEAGAALPRRLVYVVDRRAVVDQATEVAESIKKRDDALRVSTLRGQLADNRDWLADPAAPAIIVGTVDMIGSRLLFSGYGVSTRMRPYHAGLLGADTLVVLDESHLVPPFEALLRSVEGGGERLGSRGRAVPGFRLMSLSATGGRESDSPFRLQAEDLRDPVVAKRLGASKRLLLETSAGTKPEQVLAAQAWALAGEGRNPVRCIVYCDSRDVADKTAEAIARLAAAAKVAIEPPELFVGARRVKERQDAADRLKTLGFLAGSEERRAAPVFLVATSAGEVGVDLDADCMVCDLVPWERMVQRLGRVNRRGEGEARIVLVRGDEPPASDAKASTAWRSLRLLEVLPADGRGIDVSPGALRHLKLRAAGDPRLDEAIRVATTPVPLRPELTRTLVDAWSMTALDEHTGRPEVGPWLRGWVDDEPQTTVVWRAHLPVRGVEDRVEPQEIEAYFDAAPPHLTERLETRTLSVVEWLMARAAAVADVDPGAVVAIVLDAAGGYRRAYTLAQLADGGNRNRAKDRLIRDLAATTLVVDLRLGGLRQGLLPRGGDAGSPTPTIDGGGDWPKDAEGGPMAGFRVRTETRNGPAPVDRGWHKPHYFDLERDEEGFVRRLVVEKWQGAATREAERAIARRLQALADHQRLVADKVAALGVRLALPDELVGILVLAAKLHDEGKRALIWQRAFSAPPEGGPYAKTPGPLRPAVLGGYRHEFGSLMAAECHPEVSALPPDRQDLLLHLIAAHHGRARPVIETIGCDDAPPEVLRERAAAVARRFARLQERWGPWGLAWLESLLRAADQQASAELDAAASHDAGEV